MAARPGSGMISRRGGRGVPEGEGLDGEGWISSVIDCGSEGVKVGEQVFDLPVVERSCGHHAAAVEDDVSEAFVGGRSSRGHGSDFGDGLQARAVEGMGVGGVVAAGAFGLVDGRAAGFLRGPLR